MRGSICVLIVASAFVTMTQGARILAVFSFGSYSHFALGFRLVKELADRGHNVTFINPYPQKEPIENLRDISVAEAFENIGDKQKLLYKMGTKSFINELLSVSHLGYAYTENVLKVKAVQELLKSDEKFDLVLIEHFFNEAMAIFQYKFKCPSVVVAPGPTTVFNNYLFANPSQPAYIPNLLAGFRSKMRFWERLLNVVYDIIGEIFVQLVLIPNQNAILQRAVPGAPNLGDILYNTSFMLTTSHVSLREPCPLQPNIKEIGGYHLLPPRPLPRDLREYLDNAKEGVIIFSMGSFLRGDNFPLKQRESVVNALAKIDRKVLWKFETPLYNQPKNMKIMNWIPQQDVLGHPNVVAFITHGGLLGNIEAVYHGVPMLGMPLFWDQGKNINDAIRQGYALGIPLPQVTEENFSWALNELINNRKYRENAKIRSRIMRDQPVKQIDEAMYWIEYVIKHKGAPHYKSPALNLKWYQRLLLDIILLFGVVAALLYLAVVYALQGINGLYRNVKKSKLE